MRCMACGGWGGRKGGISLRQIQDARFAQVKRPSTGLAGRSAAPGDGLDAGGGFEDVN